MLRKRNVSSEENSLDPGIFFALVESPVLCTKSLLQRIRGAAESTKTVVHFMAWYVNGDLSTNEASDLRSPGLWSLSES
jgi:hypothetical protein